MCCSCISGSGSDYDIVDAYSLIQDAEGVAGGFDDVDGLVMRFMGGRELLCVACCYALE